MNEEDPAGLPVSLNGFKGPMKRKRDFTWNTGWSLTRFGRFVNEFAGKVPTAPEWAGETSHPPMDVYEDDWGVHVELEVPGMTRSDLRVRIDREKISIEGYKRSGGDSSCLRFLCVEREFGVFRRILKLPVSVDTSGVRAALEDGMLKIRVPRVVERRKSVVEVPIDG